MNFSSFSCAEKSQEASKKTVGCQDFDAQAVQQNGKKIAPEKVIAISELGNDEIIWLESGDEKAGLQHILKHGNDLRKNGIAVERLPEILIQAPLQWEIVERTSFHNGGVTLGLKHKNKFYKMIIGGNGYIVTFYPDKRLKNQT